MINRVSTIPSSNKHVVEGFSGLGQKPQKLAAATLLGLGIASGIGYPLYKGADYAKDMILLSRDAIQAEKAGHQAQAKAIREEQQERKNKGAASITELVTAGAIGTITVPIGILWLGNLGLPRRKGL